MLKKHVLCSKNGGQWRRIMRAGSESVFVYVTTRSVVAGSASTSFPSTTPGSPQLSSSSCRSTTCGPRASSGCAHRTSDTVAIRCERLVVDLGDGEPDARRFGQSLEVAQEAPEKERPLERLAVDALVIDRHAIEQTREVPERQRAVALVLEGHGPSRCRAG